MKAATLLRLAVKNATASRCTLNSAPLAALDARATMPIRGLSTTAPRLDAPAEGPESYSTTQDHIQEDYPSAQGRDVGHSTTGADRDVGKHKLRTLSSFSMANKVCVVTGAARGIGNMFARTFAESGSNSIAILDLDEALAKEAAADIETWFVEHGQAKPDEIKAIGIGCDVSNEQAVKSAFDKVVAKFGRIDVLVTAAGIVHNYPATEYPLDKYKQLMAINVDGTFFCAREAGRRMLEADQPGSIVMIGSMSGSVINVPQPQTPYNASKAAVAHMASSLAVEWAKNGIRVNCISPGYTLTSLTRTILDNNPVLRDTWEKLTPMGRLAEPEDLKGAVIYLASDASSYTTGTNLLVDGGYVLT